MNLSELKSNRALTTILQTSLVNAGYLDPEYDISVQNGIKIVPADGMFGPNTQFAFEEYASLLGVDTDSFVMNPDAFKSPINLVNGEPASLIVSALQKRGMFISTHPDTFNIVYLEGIDYDFVLNGNEPDRWNDLRILIKVRPDGIPVIVDRYLATTDPGRFYTDNPMDSDGVARIQYGQYKAWKMGFHHGTQPALQQDGPILVCRDLNKDGSRNSDKVFLVSYSVNQHSTSPSFSGTFVGKNSAGCMVGASYQKHLEYLSYLKQDVRYLRSKNYRFISAVLPGSEIFS